MFKKFRTCNCLKKYKKYRVFRIAVFLSSIKDARFLKVKGSQHTSEHRQFQYCNVCLMQDMQ
jgi:hypothetical protein